MKWLWQIAAKKAAARAVQLIISVIASQKVAGLLAAAGVTIQINPDTLSMTLAGVFMGLTEVARNYLKRNTTLRIP